MRDTPGVNKETDSRSPGMACSPSYFAYAQFHESRRQKLLAYIEKKVARHVESGGNDCGTVRHCYALDGIRDLHGHSDRDIWNAAWKACLENARAMPPATEQDHE